MFLVVRSRAKPQLPQLATMCRHPAFSPFFPTALAPTKIAEEVAVPAFHSACHCDPHHRLLLRACLEHGMAGFRRSSAEIRKQDRACAAAVAFAKSDARGPWKARDSHIELCRT